MVERDSEAADTALPIRVAVVDDHPLVRAGVSSMLQAAGGIEIVAEASDGPEAIRQAELLKPDIMLLDIRLSGASGIDVCEKLRHRAPHTKVILLTSFGEKEYIQMSLEVGAYGYLAKTASQEEIVDAISRVARGERLLDRATVGELAARLSPAGQRATIRPSEFDPAEMEILRLLAGGTTNAEIAQCTHRSEISVKRRLEAIFNKLGVDDRTSAVVEAIRRGLV